MTEITDEHLFAETEKEIVVIMIGMCIDSPARRVGDPQGGA